MSRWACIRKKGHGLTLDGKMRKVEPCLQVFSIIPLECLGWDTVKEIHKRHLRRKYKSFNLKNVRYLAIDEVYLGKKRKYITIVLDLRTGRVIHVGRGKGKDALKGFWTRLRRSKTKIQAVATDMASGYIAAVLEHLPKTDLVLDHFHLVKWFNEKLSLLRRQLYREATQMQKAVLKGSQWLLLKAPENLKSHRGPQEKRTASFAGGVGTEPAACDGLLHEGTPSAAVSMHRSRPGCDGIEGLDSRSLLQWDQNTQRGRPEAIGMEAIYLELVQTPHQHWKVGSDQQ